jgi:hypothetical protein
MIKQIAYNRYVRIETQDGIEWIPQDVIGKQSIFTASEAEPYISGQFISASLVDGYGARYTMPGYLDCTPWSVFETEAEALDYLTHYYMYDDDKDPCADL